jgi:uncharacterized protein
VVWDLPLQGGPGGPTSITSAAPHPNDPTFYIEPSFSARGAQSSAHRHHAIDYVELTVTDLEQAKRFYSEAFGWRFNDYGPEYAGIQSPQGASAPEVGGLSQGQEVRSGGLLVLLYSSDLNRSVEAVKHAGGQVVNGPYAFPGGRRFHFTDPSGNELGVWAEA